MLADVETSTLEAAARSGRTDSRADCGSEIHPIRNRSAADEIQDFRTCSIAALNVIGFNAHTIVLHVFRAQVLATRLRRQVEPEVAIYRAILPNLRSDMHRQCSDHLITGAENPRIQVRNHVGGDASA